ncbi:MAG: Sua5/YciO/YrdC/YwlC family protein [Synechococcaceae cyanobacterium]|nr:Sua5/YciO/YrdC/YwlC family protein [Synechococcaceae cyanobacterium]
MSAPSGASAASLSQSASAWVLDAPALARHLQAGGQAIFPTDTLPALAALPAHAAAIWSLKQRPAHKPLILMGADATQLQSLLAAPWPEPWLAMAERCWPGPVTLVLPLAGPLSAALHPGGASLGLRVPASPVAQELLRLTGPLATTSVNRSGEPALVDPRAAAAAFPEIPLLGPLPWPAALGQASQVLAWDSTLPESPSGGWQELRAGPASARLRREPAG